MVQMNFDSNQFDPSTGSADVFDDGEYTFHIVNSEVQETKAKNGQMLVFTLECLDPEFARKQLKVRLNVVNPSTQAVEIAMKDLAAISLVCGVPVWQDSQQLHGKPFKVRLAKTQYEENPPKYSNDVKAYMDINGNAPTKGGAPAAGTAPAAPPAPPQPAQQSAPPAPQTGIPPQPSQDAVPGQPAQPQQEQQTAPPFQQPTTAPDQPQQTGAPTPPWLQQQQT